jgi:hypothetical protein
MEFLWFSYFPEDKYAHEWAEASSFIQIPVGKKMERRPV